MNNIDNLNRRAVRLTLLCVALALAGCGKPATKSPENNLVRTTLVQPMDNSRSDGDASYLAQVRFDHETDLSFKVGGIMDRIGPATGTDPTGMSHSFLPLSAR